MRHVERGSPLSPALSPEYREEGEKLDLSVVFPAAGFSDRPNGSKKVQ
jgi:hypothetical protein